MPPSFKSLAKFEAAPAAPAAPAPVSLPAGLTEQQVKALIDECDATWSARVESLQRQIDLLTTLLATRTPATYDFPIEYRKDGSIATIAAVPRAHTLN